MKYSILKYTLPAALGQYDVSIPTRAKILDVDFQCGKICIWALVYPSGRDVRTFLIERTGAEVDVENWKYLKTLLLENGEYVLHIFEKRQMEL